MEESNAENVMFHCQSRNRNGWKRMNKIGNCFYCGSEVEHSGQEQITTENKTYTFEVFTCEDERCGKRYLVENEEEPK